MNTPRRFLLVLCFFVLLPWTGRSAESASLDPGLEGFRPLLGKTWRGEFKRSAPDRPMFDVARWERALNGKAVRVLHSVNDGAYGGETILRWNKETRQIAYHYFTTAGFMTTGTMTVESNKFVGLEKVTGTNGVTEVRSVMELRPDGSLLSKAEYLKDGKVTGSREVIYREEPKAEVRFK